MFLNINIYANDSFNSEISHVIGGMVMAGGTTAVVNSYYPKYAENRGEIGFAVSSIVIIIEQSIEYAQRGDARGQMLDVFSHIVGSAFGSFVTDKYILSPVIHKSNNKTTVGLALTHRF
jgi:hypothetical protein